MIFKTHFSINYRTTVDQINNEITALDTRIKNIKKQIELPTTEQDVKSQMTEFLQVYQKLTLIVNIINWILIRSPNVKYQCYNVE